MIEAYLQGMTSDGKVVLAFVILVFTLIITGVILQGFRDIILAIRTPLKQPAPPKPAPVQLEKRPAPSCDHEDNLKKICLRGFPGCGSRTECKTAVEDGEY